MAAGAALVRLARPMAAPGRARARLVLPARRSPRAAVVLAAWGAAASVEAAAVVLAAAALAAAVAAALAVAVAASAAEPDGAKHGI